MPMPTQLELDFRTSQLEETNSRGVPIDQLFPEQAANEIATLESFNKHLYRPNAYLHKWWARRSGTTFRYILKQLVTNSAKRGFYKAGGLEGKTILDPMMGGGTTLHEAIRMGANVIGIDIDPIPVLQVEASLTVSSLAHKKALFSRFLEALRSKLGHFYRTTCPASGKDAEIQFLLYGLRRKCSCKEVVFVDKLLLRQNKYHNVHICPQCRDIYTDQPHTCGGTVDRPLLAKGTRRCEKCHTDFADILNEPFARRYVPLVVVGNCREHGQFFKAVGRDDLELLAQARLLTQELSFGDSACFRIPRGPKSDDLLHRGVATFQELFTPRQLLYLSISLEYFSELSKEDRVWLALLISTSLEFNSLLCGYKGGDIRRPGAIRHVFSHHAYSFPYTALENNPIFSGKTSGTLNRLFHDRVLRAGQWAIAPVETRITTGRPKKVFIQGEVDGGESVSDWKSLAQGECKFLVFQGDSATLDIPEAIVDYIVTDPPYYDNVQYSDLSNFFRVWLRLFLPHEADWRYDPLASAVSEGNVSGSRKYGEVMGKIWKMCARALKREHGRLVFTFHHWNPEAWAELTLSLKKAGFVLINRYVVLSENPISVHIRGLKALKHDTILVLRLDKNNRESRTWPKPSRIDTSGSYAFCSDCGSALGWFLASDIDDEQIRSEWKQLL